MVGGSCGIAAADQAGAAESRWKINQLAEGSGPSGLVWRVTGGAVTHYLAGTLHALRAADHPMPPAYEEAYRQCRQVYFETSPMDGMNPGQRQAFFEQALYGRDRSLRSDLPVASWQKMMAFLDRNRFPAGDISRARPWYAAVRLREYALEKAGFRKNLGVEQIYFAKARASGRMVGGLSTFEDQVARSSGVDEAEQLSSLIHLIDHLEETGREAALIAGAWREGNIAALNQAVTPSADVVSSNLLWTRRLRQLITGSGVPTMILIGAAHFAGNKGIQRLLP